jgi:cytoskeletal protein CcmA (bactofilin family)
MDYLAESGLEHARGLILNDSNYLGDWEGRLVEGSNDYYKVNVVCPSECNYVITCDAYRGSDKMSSLEAELRLDPCIALWMQIGTTISSGVRINGDVYCGGTLVNNGIINGDVFVGSLSGAGTGSITGRRKTAGELSLTRPQITVGDYSYNYTIIEANIPSGSYYPGIVYCPNNILLSGNVNITGMLIAGANLTVQGNGNIVTAGENLPAMLVTGELRVGNGSQLTVNGLAVVNGRVRNNGGINITGGLFVENGIIGVGNMTITAAPSKTAITTWPSPGNPVGWSPVAGAFFKSIERP